MPAKSVSPVISFPRAWPSRVKSGILHVISLAQFTIAYTRGGAADSANTRARLKAERDGALQDNALIRQEMRIKDVRMAWMPWCNCRCRSTSSPTSCDTSCSG